MCCPSARRCITSSRRRRARHRAVPGSGADRIPGARRHQPARCFRACSTRSAERVARDGYRGLKAGRRMVVPASANQVVTAAYCRCLPHAPAARRTASSTLAPPRKRRLARACSARRSRRAIEIRSRSPRHWIGARLPACRTDPDRHAPGEFDAWACRSRPAPARLSARHAAAALRRSAARDHGTSMPAPSSSAAR